MILAHRIALDPTIEQQIALARACGVARFTWNWALNAWNKKYQAGEKTKANDLKLEWNKVKHELYPWVGESPKDANQRPFANLHKAFQRFFQKKSKYPTFKRKGQHDSFYVSNDKFKVVGLNVQLPVIGPVRLRETLRFKGKIISGTVSREADRWFISIQVDTKINPLAKNTKQIGIDLGVKTAVVCSDGKTFDSPKPIKGNLKLLRRRSRQHARKKKGSNNRKKAQRQLARLHVRIKNIRRDWTHKITTKLIRENQTICLEDLNVKGMLANRNLSRAISDVGFFELRRQLEYKAKLYGREIRFVGRLFPSSKTCSNCGHKKDVLALSERVFACENCGFEIERDLNAAKNICTAGLAGSNVCGPEGSGLGSTKTKPCRVETETRTVGA